MTKFGTFARRVLLALTVLLPIAADATAFGTFDHPFAANSPWNSRPVSPVFGTTSIPDDVSGDFPVVAGGAFSTQAFQAATTDPAMVVLGPTTAGTLCASNLVWAPDAGVCRTITIPHWPAAATPATGTDGHCEIVDVAAGIVHSFWQLKKPVPPDTVWRATQYTWTALNGRGWGDPAHWMQGPRSSGVSTLGGLIRQAEINDGDTQFRHALAMSMTYSGLSKAPVNIFPATSADTDAASANTGPFPLGSLMMLPSTFNVASIHTAMLRKVALTLQTYGAYAVDRNVGTPFAIYVENGPVGYQLMPAPSYWDNNTATDLRNIQHALRQVTGAASWIDGNGASFPAFATNLNMLSMRGPWAVVSGKATTAQPWFDTYGQTLQFNGAPADPPLVVSNFSGNVLMTSSGVVPVKGKTYHLVAHAINGAKTRLLVRVWNQTRKNYDTPFDSGWMADWAIIGTAAVPFVWPGADRVDMEVQSPPNGTSGSAYMTLVKMP